MRSCSCKHELKGKHPREYEHDCRSLSLACIRDNLFLFNCDNQVKYHKCPVSR